MANNDFFFLMTNAAWCVCVTQTNQFNYLNMQINYNKIKTVCFLFSMFVDFFNLTPEQC